MKSHKIEKKVLRRITQGSLRCPFLFTSHLPPGHTLTYAYPPFFSIRPMLRLKIIGHRSVCIPVTPPPPLFLVLPHTVVASLMWLAGGFGLKKSEGVTDLCVFATPTAAWLSNSLYTVQLTHQFTYCVPVKNT